MQGTIIVVDDNKGVLSAVKLLLKNSFERPHLTYHTACRAA